MTTWQRTEDGKIQEFPAKKCQIRKKTHPTTLKRNRRKHSNGRSGRKKRWTILKIKCSSNIIKHRTKPPKKVTRQDHELLTSIPIYPQASTITYIITFKARCQQNINYVTFQATMRPLLAMTVMTKKEDYSKYSLIDVKNINPGKNERIPS